MSDDHTKLLAGMAFAHKDATGEPAPSLAQIEDIRRSIDAEYDLFLEKLDQNYQALLADRNALAHELALAKARLTKFEPPYLTRRYSNDVLKALYEAWKEIPESPLLELITAAICEINNNRGHLTP